MNMSLFDASQHRWREVTDPEETSYLVHHDYTVLGYDIDAGVFDMIVRWHGDGGHCHRHRHIATTSILVLDGEQHLRDLHADGSKGDVRIRRKGDYGLSVGIETPHMECGGENGGVAFFGSHAGSDGVLYELLDADLNLIAPITIEMLVEDWEQHAQ